jgi:TolB-like protein
MKLKFITTIFILSGIISNISANDLKKVLVLPFNNISQKADYNYLENSIADSIRDMLKKKFAFQETAREDWEATANENFIYWTDYYTPTASMNLGLLAKQDIVISGGFTTEESSDKILIHILVKIYDIGQKKILSDLKVTGEASNNIFQTIDEVTLKVSGEAKKVLPNKEDWQKKGIVVADNKPFFTGFQIGLGSGGGFYVLGFADNLSPNFPSLSVFIKAFMPKIWSRQGMQLQFDYFTHSLNPSSGNLSLINVSGETANYIPSIYFGIYLPVAIKGINSISIFPKIGAALVFQTTTLTGDINETYDNSFFAAAAGVDISYDINKFFSAALTMESFIEFEADTTTLFNQFTLGVNFMM